MIPVSNQPVTCTVQEQASFVDITPSIPVQAPQTAFSPAAIIRKGDLEIEISATAPAELLALIGGILNAE